MKKIFETPKMNISAFEAENIITASGEAQAEAQEIAKTAIQKAADNSRKVTEILTFVF